jgi:hypothetical protein
MELQFQITIVLNLFYAAGWMCSTTCSFMLVSMETQEFLDADIGISYGALSAVFTVLNYPQYTFEDLFPNPQLVDRAFLSPAQPSPDLQHCRCLMIQSV